MTSTTNRQMNGEYHLGAGGLDSPPKPLPMNAPEAARRSTRKDRARKAPRRPQLPPRNRNDGRTPALWKRR